MSLFSFTDWQNDILGDDFEMKQVVHKEDKHNVISSIIRLKTNIPSKFGILYIHGYNDYFYQHEMAHKFDSYGFSFYAIDLRKYGRSLKENDTPFEIKNIENYFPDINVALTQMQHDGIEKIILMGHSTGGLIACSYLNNIENSAIIGLILNSPFLEWNLKPILKKIAIPIVSCIGKFIPTISIKQPTTIPYAHSLLKAYHGEWDFNTTWKFIQAPNVTSQWIRAINIAQKKLHKSSLIKIPILLLRSSSSVYGNRWTKDFNRGDAILNVNDISKYGKKLGQNVHEVVCPNGLHDLVLSNNDTRNFVYSTIFNWIKRHGFCHKSFRQS